MKVRLLFAALAASVAVASVAFAKGDPGSDHPEGPAAAGCKKGMFVLKGSFLAGGPSSFQMQVRKASRHGRALRGPRELLVDGRTRFRRNGGASALASLEANDRLKVLARGCKRSDRAVELLARRVSARAAD